jgi:hypothetical protein
VASPRNNNGIKLRQKYFIPLCKGNFGLGRFGVVPSRRTGWAENVKRMRKKENIQIIGRRVKTKEITRKTNR